MRRIKIKADTQRADKLPIEQLRIKYRAFKKANPEKYVRVPVEIKLLAKSIIKSGVTVHALAGKLDLAAPSIWSWLKSLDQGGQSIRKPSTPPLSHPPKAKPTQEKRPIAADLEKLKSEYGRLAFSDTLKNPESQWRLGELAKDLTNGGASVEDLTAATGAHPLTVRSWLKNLQRKPPPEVETAVEMRDERIAIEQDDRQPANDEALSAMAAASASQAASGSGRASGWVKIRVSGHVMEVDWNDLMQRLPLVRKSMISTGGMLTSAADGEIDFNRVINEDGDFSSAVDAFEKTFIQNAMDRHSSIGECARAINLPRSTLDAKRRKYSLD